MTVKESLYFSYDGKKSKDFGIINVTNTTGLLEESFVSEIEIKEVYVRGNDKPYFQEIMRRPLVLTLNFAFEDKWDNDKIRDVARWLSQTYYKPLWFSDNPNRIYYCLLDSSSKLLHNGLKQGHVELQMRCNSPYTYSPQYASPVYDFSMKNVNYQETTYTDFSKGFLDKVVANETDNLLMLKSENGSYPPYGERVTDHIDLSPIGICKSSNISWSTLNDTGTSITIKTSIDNGTTWQTAINNSPIPNIDRHDSMIGKKLIVKQILETTATSTTPRLEDMTLTINSYSSAPLTIDDGINWQEGTTTFSNLNVNPSNQLELYFDGTYYSSSGDRIFEIDLSRVGIAMDNCEVLFDSVETDSSYMEILFSIDGGTTWELVTGYDNKEYSKKLKIPVISYGDELKGSKLMIHQRLKTTDTSSTPKIDNFKIVIDGGFEFVNHGDIECKPEIWITKIGDGNISLKNNTDGGKEFTFSNLKDGETIYIDNDNQYIESSLKNIYRYDDFNNYYLTLVRGHNLIKVNGNCKLNMRYIFKTMQG